MKSKLMQMIPALVALIGIGIAPASYWCIYSNGVCSTTWINHIYQYVTNPFFNFALYFLPAAIILIFVRGDIFNSWLKFALWAIPLSTLFIAAMPVSSGAYMLDFSLLRDGAARLGGGVLTVFTLLFVAWKYFKSRNIRTS